MKILLQQNNNYLQDEIFADFRSVILYSIEIFTFQLY